MDILSTIANNSTAWLHIINSNSEKIDERLIKQDLKANIPAFGKGYRLFYATDTKEWFYDNNAAWVKLGVILIGALGSRPAAGNQNSLFIDESSREFYIDDGAAWQLVKAEGTVSPDEVQAVCMSICA